MRRLLAPSLLVAVLALLGAGILAQAPAPAAPQAPPAAGGGQAPSAGQPADAAGRQGGGRAGGGGGGRGGGVAIQPGQECPPGMTEWRTDNCRGPEFPAPSILDYRPRSTLVVAEHQVPKAKYGVVDYHA